LGAAWIVTRMLRGWSAATRHLIWTGAIAGVLLLPVLTMTAPSWDVPVLDQNVTADFAARGPVDRGESPLIAAPPALQAVEHSTLAAPAAVPESSAPSEPTIAVETRWLD